MTADGSAWAPPECYLTRQQLVELMGVSVKTIDRMVRAEMSSHLGGHFCARGHWLAPACARFDQDGMQ